MKNIQNLRSPRAYKYKNPAVNFFCPLCRAERGLTIRSRPSGKNYLQIALTSLCLSSATYPLMGYRCWVWFFFVWVCFEGLIKINFRKQIPCPHCGFDAIWYKRDVKIAKKMVLDFQEKNQRVSTQAPSPIPSSIPTPAS